ncbi:type 1 glutamine amidotransferase [Cellulomonas soli]|uniref:type 1 glutamine amidotransferase n=1 Tax=Cellulomonas soli TaxID=931535 RepID=UPI003F87C44B
MSPAHTPVVTVVQLDAGVPLDRFADWLDGVETRTVHAYRGEPLTVDEVGDGLIVLGGQMSALDVDVPGIAATRTLLAEAVAAGVPTLGICLGAQLLAVAQGGRVHVAAPPGREAGVIEVHWRPEALTDALVGPLLDPGTPEERRTTPMPSMHADAVVDLPRGAVWLAHSRQYPYQAFRVGPSAWGLQFHPEASPATLHAWAQLHADVDTAAVDEAVQRHDRSIAAHGALLARTFAGVVRERTQDAVLV